MKIIDVECLIVDKLYPYVVIQTDEDIIPNILLEHRKKLIALSGRERFVYNVNPTLFKSDFERKNLSVENNDSKKCDNNSSFKLLPSKNNEFPARINTQCAFNALNNKQTTHIHPRNFKPLRRNKNPPQRA